MARDSQVRLVVRSLGQFTTRKIKKIVLDVTANLVEDTPRDTGWARNNWIPEIGPGPDNPVGEPGDSNAAKAVQQKGIASVALGYKLGMGIITITDNVPYIVRLNEGSSQQAPAGFVQAAIFRAVQGAEKGGGGSLSSGGGGPARDPVTGRFLKS